MCKPMKWERLLSDKRLHARCSGRENGRTQFEKGSLTSIAFCPIYRYKTPEFIKKLKLI